jgi:hypothetical protein
MKLTTKAVAIRAMNPDRRCVWPEEDKVADGAHGAETAPLGEETDREADAERHGQGRMHGSRTLHAVEKHPAFRFAGDLGKDQEQAEQSDHDKRQHPARRVVGSGWLRPKL